MFVTVEDALMAEFTRHVCRPLLNLVPGGELGAVDIAPKAVIDTIIKIAGETSSTNAKTASTGSGAGKSGKNKQRFTNVFSGKEVTLDAGNKCMYIFFNLSNCT